MRIDANRREHIAKYMSDVSKAIVAVGLASKFFLDLSIGMRMWLGIMAFILFMISIWFQPPKGGSQ